MVKQHISCVFALLLFTTGLAHFPASAAPSMAPVGVHYADLAALALPAEIVAKVRVLEVIEVKPTAGAERVPNYIRLYVDAQIEALIKGAQDTPKQVSFLVDVPLDAHGHAPKIKKSAQLIFARAVLGRSGFVQLNAPDAMLDWTDERESLARSILVAKAATDSPPHVTGIDTGFSVAGTVAGERETQIFLRTDSRPVSLTISHHPGEATQWSVALGEIADHGVPPPPPNTLLWYELACMLPAHYPDAKLSGQTEEAAGAIRTDYDFVVQSLGPCERGR